MAASFLVISTLSIIEIMLLERNVDSFTDLNQAFFCARKFLNWMNGIGTGIDAIPNGMSSKFPLHGALTNGTITLIRRLLAARDLTTFTIIADFYTVELILYRNMCSHFETGFAPNPICS